LILQVHILKNIKQWANEHSKKKEETFQSNKNELNKEQAEIPQQTETNALLNDPEPSNLIKEEFNENKAAIDSQSKVTVEKPHRNRKIKHANDKTPRIQDPTEIPPPTEIAKSEILVEQENKTQKPKEKRKRAKRKPKNIISISTPSIPTPSIKTPSVPSVTAPSVSTSAISAPSVSALSKQDGCLHQLGFLHEISKVDDLPEECMTCQKLLQCRYD
jgi:hypothetical protein